MMSTACCQSFTPSIFTSFTPLFPFLSLMYRVKANGGGTTSAGGLVKYFLNFIWLYADGIRFVGNS